MYTLTISADTREELFNSLRALLEPESHATHTSLLVTPTIPDAVPAAPLAALIPLDPAPVAPLAALTPPDAVLTAPLVAPIPAAPITAVPVSAPTYTMEQLAHAGGFLAHSGKMDQALALLAKYSIKTISELNPAQYGAFAAELRALGAQL
jgi:hypothetical protein